MYLYVLYAYAEGGPKLFVLANQEATIFFLRSLAVFTEPRGTLLATSPSRKKKKKLM